LSRKLGIPVVETVATKGHGISTLFEEAVKAVRDHVQPSPPPVSDHISAALDPLKRALDKPEVSDAFRIPAPFLLDQIASGHPFFRNEMQMHFPELTNELARLRIIAEGSLPRTLADELHADRHHRAASLFEGVSRIGGDSKNRGWRFWLDELFLDPRWGLLGSLLVFALVLFFVFEVGTWLDSMTAARLIDAVSVWQPTSTIGVVGRAVVDGLIGLVGIVVPFMIPLVLLLVVLEETGIMHRIAFVLDRAFHKIGLHGSIAVPFLLGLGCNVPALSAAAVTATGRERIVASLLITFVPCSARSAIILALAGKYLGGFGVFAIFFLTMLVIGVLGRLLSKRYPESGPGQVQSIPPYGLPRLSTLLSTTWERTSDILTIVTPLLVIGSVILALLAHIGADQVVNTLLTPISAWWLGLPVVLGVPILFGVLRKELSLLMIYQALGTFEVGQYLDWVQITTFLLFLTFYVPCVSTFAVMLRTIGKREAVFSLGLSVGVALLVSGVVRLLLELFRIIAL
jgi:ferrous iron transport protein B